MSKRIVVTGGSDGIGLAIASAFSDLGAEVLIIGRDTAKLDAARILLGDNAKSISTDLSKSVGIQTAATSNLNIWNEIDVLINNAGIARFLPFEETDEDALDLHLNLNVKAPFLLTRALLKALKLRQGCVVNISSFFAQRMFPARPSSAYSLSKGAIESFTKELAFEVGPHGIRVNAIAPGTVRTPLMQQNLASMPDEARAKLLGMVKTVYPLGRLGIPEEIAGAAVFLSSEKARWITGAILPVDGG